VFVSVSYYTCKLETHTNTYIADSWVQSIVCLGFNSISSSFSPA